MYLLAFAPIRMRNVYQNAKCEQREKERVKCVCERVSERMPILPLDRWTRITSQRLWQKFEVLNVWNLFPYCKGSLSLWSIFYVCMYIQYIYLLYTMLLIRRVIIHDIRSEHLECYGVNAFVHIETFQNRICIYVGICLCVCVCSTKRNNFWSNWTLSSPSSKSLLIKQKSQFVIHIDK